MEISFRHLILIFTVLFSWATMARSVVVEDKASDVNSQQMPKAITDILDQLDKCAQRLYPGSKIDQDALIARFGELGGYKDVSTLCYQKTMTKISSLTKEQEPMLLKAIKDRDLKRTASLNESPRYEPDNPAVGSR
jgi:hypothetical protein